MEPNTSTIIVGIMSVIATYVSTLIVDKLGRKILLLSSIVVMGICTFLIGVFFYLKAKEYDTSSIGFIPLASLCVFIILFSIGFGPIPWMLVGEIFPAQIKGKLLIISNHPTCVFYIQFEKFIKQVPLVRSPVCPTGSSLSWSRNSSHRWYPPFTFTIPSGYSHCSAYWVRSS